MKDIDVPVHAPCIQSIRNASCINSKYLVSWRSPARRAYSLLVSTLPGVLEP